MGRGSPELARNEGARGVRATELGLLVDVDGEGMWLPQSMIHDDSEVWLDYLARGMMEAEAVWAREFVDRVSAATIAGADADLRALAEEVAHRLTFWSRSATRRTGR